MTCGQKREERDGYGRNQTLSLALPKTKRTRNGFWWGGSTKNTKQKEERQENKTCIWNQKNGATAPFLFYFFFFFFESHEKMGKNPWTVHLGKAVQEQRTRRDKRCPKKNQESFLRATYLMELLILPQRKSGKWFFLIYLFLLLLLLFSSFHFFSSVFLN